MAEVAVAHTGVAEAAIYTDFAIGAVFTFFAAVRTDLHTLRAASATVADKLCTVFTKLAFITEMPITAGAVFTDAAVAADLFGCAVGTFLPTFLTDHSAIRTSVAAETDILYAEFADTAFCAVVALTADTVKAGPTITAELVISAVFSFFSSIRSDHRAF